MSPQNEVLLRDTGAEAPSPGARSLFGCCGSPRCQKQRVPRQPRVPDVQVSPGLVPHGPEPHGPEPHGPIPCGTGSVPAAERSLGQLPAVLSNDNNDNNQKVPLFVINLLGNVLLDRTYI